MSAGVLLVVWQGGEKVVNGAMTVGALHRLPGALSALRQPWLSGAPDDQLHPGRRRCYARLRPLLAPPPHLQRATRSSFRAGHSLESRSRRLNHPPFPPDRWRSPCTGSPSATRPLPRQRCTTSGWTFRLAPWSRSRDPLAQARARWPGHCWACTLWNRAKCCWMAVPLEDIPVAERAARTGYLAQDPYLFSGTVRATSCWAR